MRSSIDISAYRETGAAVTKSKHAVRQVEDSVGRRYFAKPEIDSEVVQTEMGAQELIRFLYSKNPKTLCATDARNPRMTYVLSESVEGFRSLYDLIDDMGEAEVVRKIKEGEYTGFGNVVVMSLLTNEADLHEGNIGVNANGEFVKIDGDWANGRVRYHDDPAGFTFNITEDVFNSLPKLDPNSYLPYNWFNQVGGGLLDVRSGFLDQLVGTWRVQQEIHRQTLKCLMLPSEYLVQIMQSVHLGKNDSSVMIINYCEHAKAMMQLLRSACFNDDFAAFLTTQDAEDMKSELISEMKAYKLIGGDGLKYGSEIEARVSQAFDGVVEMSSLRMKPDEKDDVYSKIVAKFTGVVRQDKHFLLCAAVESGDVALTRSVAPQCGDIDRLKLENNTTLFLRSIMSGPADLYHCLASFNPNKLAVDNDGYNALHLAARYNRHDILPDIMTYIDDIDSVNKTGKTALIIAAREGNSEVVEALIKAGADVRHEGKDGLSALYYAAIGGFTETVEKFLESPAVVDKFTDIQLQEILVGAIINHQFDVAKQLVDKFGVDKFSYNSKCANYLIICAAHFGDDDLYAKVKPECSDFNKGLIGGGSALTEAATSQSYAIFNDLLEQKGIDVGVLDKDKRSIFFTLVDNGKINIAVDLAIKHNAVNSPIDALNNRLIHYAVHQNETTLLQKLIDHNADVNVENKNIDSPLYFAVLEEYVDCIKILLASNKIPQVEINGALIYAIENARHDLMSFLIEECHADVNCLSADGQGHTPLIIAAMTGNKDAVHYLLSNPLTDVNYQDDSGCTAFSGAVQKGRIDVIYLLGRHDKVDLSLEDNDGESAMVKLVGIDLEHCVDLVLQRDMPNFTMDSLIGLSILHVACFDGNDACIAKLLAAGADVNSLSKENESPLFTAAESGFVDSVKLLLDNGAEASIHVAKENGLTPLMAAILNNHDAVIDVILATNQVDYSSVNSATGDTLLHYAVEAGNHKLIDYLATKNVNFEVKNADGKTPVQLASVLRDYSLEAKLIALAEAAKRARYDALRAKAPAPQEPDRPQPGKPRFIK